MLLRKLHLSSRMKIQTSDRIEVINCIARFSKEDREDFIAKVKTAIVAIPNRPQQICFVSLYSIIPKADLSEKVFDECVRISFDAIGRSYIRKFGLLAPKDRVLAISSIAADKYLLYGSFIHNLSSIHPNVRENCYEYLSTSLDRVREDRSAAYSQAQFILNNMDDLSLDQDHPLVQKAIEVSLLSNPRIQGDRKNPYVLYTTLIRLKEPLVECSFPESDGMKMNIEKFREVGNANPLTFADLPKIDKNLLPALLEGLKIVPAKRKSNKLRAILQVLVLILLS